MKARVSSSISSNTSRVSQGDKFLLSLEKVQIYLLDPISKVMNEMTFSTRLPFVCHNQV
jgi:hypothetical protein